MTAEVSVTIKGGKEHGEPWLVYKGDVADVQQALITSFGFNSEQVHGLTLAELTRTAADHMKAVGAVAVQLGGAPVTPAAQAATPPAVTVDTTQPAAASDDPWEGVEVAGGPAPTTWPETEQPAPPAGPNAELITAIGQAPDLNAIQRLWSTNQEAFNDPQVQKAVTDRRQQLGA